MKEEKKCTGFRVKWADREIEYYGESASDVFNKVFEHVKSIPVGVVQPSPIQGPSETQQTTTQKQQPSIPVEGAEYKRIANDAKTPVENVPKTIEFKKIKEFSELVPFLPKHPVNRDAVVLVSYALQVGLQKTQIEVSYLKKLLKGPNGYPLPGNEYGVILKDFRNYNLIIASQTVDRNKPFTLSKKGLNRARKLLKSNQK
jgi:hypothetical protein